jgi:hypothetical protein
MSDCRKCEYGTFVMTAHRPPRVNQAYFGKCVAVVNFSFPKFVDPSEIQRALSRNNIDPNHAAEGDCLYYAPQIHA